MSWFRYNDVNVQLIIHWERFADREVERRRIDTMSLPRGRWTIMKHMTQMSTTMGADKFGAPHAVGVVWYPLY
jgi:hypothetical protein